MNIGSAFRNLAPAAWPVVWLHALTGFVIATGPTALGMGHAAWLQVVVACGIWAICLAAPAIGLTRLLDPERNGAAHDAPVGTGWLALALVLFGLFSTLVIGWGYFEAYLAGIILIVLHAAPPVRLAQWPVLGVLSEGTGLAGITFLGGFAIGGGLRLSGQSVLPALGFVTLYVVTRGLLMTEGRLASVWLYWGGLAVGFAGLLLGEMSEVEGWRAGLPLIALPFWIGAGLRRLAGLGVVPLALPSVLVIWAITDLAMACAALAR